MNYIFLLALSVALVLCNERTVRLSLSAYLSCLIIYLCLKADYSYYLLQISLDMACLSVLLTIRQPFAGLLKPFLFTNIILHTLDFARVELFEFGNYWLANLYESAVTASYLMQICILFLVACIDYLLYRRPIKGPDYSVWFKESYE